MKCLTSEQEHNYITFTSCHICELEIIHPDDKVRTHYYYSGVYRGSAHGKCNLDCRKPRFIPSIDHKIIGYDNHLIIKQLAAQFPLGKLRAIPENTEKYISVDVDVLNVRLKLSSVWWFSII